MSDVYEQNVHFIDWKKLYVHFSYRFTMHTSSLVDDPLLVPCLEVCVLFLDNLKDMMKDLGLVERQLV